jgi:HAD superfamily hydrolase (TIGR01490 family)
MAKSLAFFDIDNTVYDGFSYISLIRKERKKGLISHPSWYKILATMGKYKTGAIDYEAAAQQLLDIHAQEIKGKTLKQAHEIAKQFFAHSDKFYPYIHDVIDKLKPTHRIIFVTAEPQYAAAALTDVLRGDDYFSTEFSIHQGIFTGEIKSSLAHRTEKLKAIREIIEKEGAKGSLAFGDSEGDIDMLSAVEHPICINPTPGLLTIAKEKNWHIGDPGNTQALVAALPV